MSSHSAYGVEGHRRTRPSGKRGTRERGTIVVLSAIWVSSFMALVAFCLDLAFINIALLSQRNMADALALGIGKRLLAPENGAFDCRALTQSYGESTGAWQVRMLNCAIEKVIPAASSALPGTNGYPQMSSEDLKLVWNPEDTNCTTTGAPGKVSQVDGACGFDPSHPDKGQVILGKIVGNNFNPVGTSDFQSGDSIIVRLRLGNTQSSLFLPMLNLIGSTSVNTYSNTVVARFDGASMKIWEPAVDLQISAN